MLKTGKKQTLLNRFSIIFVNTSKQIQKTEGFYRIFNEKKVRMI